MSIVLDPAVAWEPLAAELFPHRVATPQPRPTAGLAAVPAESSPALRGR